MTSILPVDMMAQASVRAFKAAVNSVFPRGFDKQTMQRTRVFSLGCMTASAAGSPILRDSTFSFMFIWYLDIVVFFGASAIFIWLHLEEMEKYGPYTLILAAILFITAPRPSRADPNEFAPWIPVALCVFLLLTSYSLPRIHELFHAPQDTSLLEVELEMEEGRSTVSQGFIVEPGSIQSFRTSSFRGENFLMDRFFAQHEVSNMDRPDSALSGTLSNRESDIVLEENFHSSRVNTICRASFLAFQSPSESGRPSSRYPAGPVNCSQQPMNESPWSPSPGSENSHYTPPAVEGCTRPLLGQARSPSPTWEDSAAVPLP